MKDTDTIVRKSYSEIIGALRRIVEFSTTGKALLDKVELIKNFNQVDENKQTILHHVIKNISQNTIQSPYQLISLADIIRDIVSHMGDDALHLPDSEGFGALQLAANHHIPEIFWASIFKGLPENVEPYFGRPKSNFSHSNSFTSSAELNWGTKVANNSQSSNAYNASEQQDSVVITGNSESSMVDK